MRRSPMALILRGKDKGKIVKLHQWCNDWFTIEDSNKVYSPTSIRLDANEIKEFLLSDSGHMLSWYELIIPDGIFKKTKRMLRKRG